MSSNSTTRGPFALTVLDWDVAALEPVISARTVRLHLRKHHAGYVRKANKMALSHALGGKTPNGIVIEAYRRGLTDLYHNAAQACNHDTYWRSLTPRQLKPVGELRDAIIKDFGSLATLRTLLTDSGGTHFASGWLWLVRTAQGALEVQTTGNAGTPVTDGHRCLLVVDLWEHAYYLDHQNERARYLKKIVGSHLNWGYAASQFEQP
ncbi:MAG: superoxide dismutase [Steroidobacteraceae bacterium]